MPTTFHLHLVSLPVRFASIARFVCVTGGFVDTRGEGGAGCSTTTAGVARASCAVQATGTGSGFALSERRAA